MSTSKQVSFTVGVYVTVLVNAWKIIQTHGAIYGENFLNHFFDVKGKSDE